MDDFEHELDQAPYELGHSLAFLYLTFATYTDGELDETELAIIAQRLAAWPQVRDPHTTIGESSEVWKNLTKTQTLKMFLGLATQLGRQFGASERQRMYEDIKAIANADGLVKPGELTYMKTLRAIWNLD